VAEPDTAGDGPENLLQLGPGRWRYPPELQPVRVPEVDPVQYQQVEVDVQVRVIACIEDPAVIGRILAPLDRPAPSSVSPILLPPARGPPGQGRLELS